MYHYIMSFFLSLFLCHHVFHQHPKHLPLSKLNVLLDLQTLLTILSFSGRWIFALRSQQALFVVLLCASHISSSCQGREAKQAKTTDRSPSEAWTFRLHALLFCVLCLFDDLFVNCSFLSL